MSAHAIPTDWAIADFRVADPGNGKTVNLQKGYAVVDLDIAAGVAETGGIPEPTDEAQVLIIVATAVGAGGSRALTIDNSGTFLGGSNTKYTFDALGEAVKLESVQVGSTLKWWATAVSGATAG